MWDFAVQGNWVSSKVVKNKFTLAEMDNLSSFQKALHANALCSLRSLAADALLEPIYLKSVTWLMGSPIAIVANRHRLEMKAAGVTICSNVFCLGKTN